MIINIQIIKNKQESYKNNQNDKHLSEISQIHKKNEETSKAKFVWKT